MKRSEINQIMASAKSFLAEHKFYLPEWAYWSVDDWNRNKADSEEIFQNMLGWDITDFGSGDFYKRGLFLFTLRNGSLNTSGKPYAEKVMIVEEDQETPMHFHWSKMEDIINRGGGNLIIEIYNSSEKQINSSPVSFKIDGIKHTVAAGSKVKLLPGNSICLEQNVFHRFYGEQGSGRVLVGEVSMVNDDKNDNLFLDEIGRFPQIIEDTAPLHLLVGDYSKYLNIR